MKLGRSFRALLTANIAANAGDGLMYTALPLLALSIHNDPLTASAPRIAAQVAPLVSGVFIGLLVDRYRRKFILLNSNIIRLAIISSFAVVVTLGNATVILIILVAIIWGIFENSFDAASMVTVPDHVKTSQLELANGQLSAGQRVAQGFVAVPIAAAAFAILKPLPFLVGVVLLVISILAVLLIQRQPRCERSSQDDESMTAWHALTRGFVLVWRTRALRSVIGLNISLLTLLQFSQGALVFYAVSVLHTPEAAYGLVVTGAAAGAIVGSVTAGLVVARFSPRSTALLSGIALDE